MHTIRATLDHKLNKHGQARVYVRLTIKRRTKNFRMPVLIEPKYWNATKHQVRATHAKAPIYNAAIQSFIDRLEAICLQLHVPSLEAVQDVLGSAPASDTVATGFERLKASMSTATERYIVALTNRFKLFDRFAPNCTYVQLTPSLAKDFATHIYSQYSVNYANSAIKTMRRLCQLAIDEGHLTHNPFLSIKPKEAKVERTRLTIDELETIRSLPLKGLEALCRDIFLFQFNCAGMRIADALRLQKSQIQADRAVYTMRKTGTNRSIKLSAEAQAIVGRYQDNPTSRVFPVLPDSLPTGYKGDKQVEGKTALINKYLKKIAKKADIDKNVSTHVARHTFADLARQATSDVYAVSKALGHSSLAVTQTYLASFDQGAVDNVIEELFGKIKSLG